MAPHKTGQQSTAKLISLLARTCRQTLTYLEGASCMDENKAKRALRIAIKEVEKHRKS